jgi:hypothetical protein
LLWQTLYFAIFRETVGLIREILLLQTKTQIAGVTVVADLSGFGFKHIRQLET